MSLSSLVRSSQWSEVDKEWAALMSNEGPVAEAIAAVEAAADTKHVTRVLPLVREHADMLEANGRPQEAANLLGAVLLAGGPPGELSSRLFRTAEAGWGAEAWWDQYTGLVEFHEGTLDVRKAWKGLSQLIGLGAGSFVYHRSGWGVGEVKEVDGVKLEAKVVFASGRKDWFPIKSLIETCDVLEDSDMRSLVKGDPDELKRLLKEEPLKVLEGVVRRYGTRMKQGVLKSAMSQLKLEGTSFTSWWRKARKAAETSSNFEVTGTGANTLVCLLDAEADPVESMRRQIRLSRDLSAALTRVRDLMTGSKLPEDQREAAFETLDQLAAQEDADDASRMATWMFLRNERKETPLPLAARMQRAMEAEESDDMAVAPELWQLFGTMSGAREQESCVDLLREIHGEDAWLDHVSANILHAAPGMARALVDVLLTDKRHEVLAKTYTTLLIRPERNPALFVAVADQAEKGKIKGDFAPKQQRLHSFLLLAGTLHDGSAADSFRGRAQARLVTLLCGGETPLMATLLEGAKRSEVKNFMPMVSKGVDTAIDRTFTHVAVSLFSDIFRDGSRPFWEMENVVWTTREGLAKREAELKELRDVKIPANSEAIGKAASYGDLSENSEWEAAIEEQRNLTARAMEIEDEVRKAQLLENTAIPPDTVAPGTQVRYVEVESKTARSVRIFGPWDSEGEDDISYRSPIAQGMLGHKLGEEVTLILPQGELQISIQEVTIVPLVSEATA